jgi:putative membrane protein
VTTPPAGTRTLLAWQRTGLGLIAVGALMGARAFSTGSESLLVTSGAAAVVGAAGLGLLAPLRVRRLQRRWAAGEGVAAPGAALTLSLAVVLVAVTALAALVLTLP